MKILSILLLSLSTLGFADILSETGTEVSRYESKLPTTLVVKDGNVVGTLDQEISSEAEAKKAIAEGNFKPAKVLDEKNGALGDSATDSCYYCGHFGGYYNYYNYSYGFHYGYNHFQYNPYFYYGSFGFYRYSHFHYHRYHRWNHHRYFWW